jgi:tetratricopeptide (TPR) repeat protein
MRYFTYGAFDSSLAVLEELRETCPGQTRIYDRIAMIRVRLGQYEELIRDFEEIARAYPGYEKGLFWLGLGYLQTEQPAEAVVWFRRAVSLDRNLALAHYHLGIAEERLGRFDEAIRAWEEAIRSDPNGRTGSLARASRDEAVRIRDEARVGTGGR